VLDSDLRQGGDVPEIRFVCQLPNGLHARPASHLADVTHRFSSNATLVNTRTGVSADVSSVLALLSADIRLHDTCVITVEGGDAADHAALAAALERFVVSELGLHDAPLPAISHDATATARLPLPAFLRDAGVVPLYGTPVSRGIAMGQVMVVAPAMRHPDETPTDRPEMEQRWMDDALAALHARLSGQLAIADRGVDAELLATHRAIVDDPILVARLGAAIRQGDSAQHAVAKAGAWFASAWSASENAYLRDRAFDIQDVTDELLALLQQAAAQRRGTVRSADGDDLSDTVVMAEPTILVAAHLTPRRLLSLDRTQLRGLVLEHGGTTSHTVILARAFGIPVLVGAHGATRAMASGKAGVIDTVRGFVLSDVTLSVLEWYGDERRRERQRDERLAAAARHVGETADGHSLEIGANVSTAGEITAAFTHGADGIGLLRTEMLFLHRATPPSEDEQFEVYAHAARSAAERGVIIRTLDVGGDKPVSYLPIPTEDNPFLGVRGVRLYAHHPALIREHLRAIVRASAIGRVRLMIPMVTSVDDVVWLKGEIAAVQGALRAEGIAFNPSMQIGAMIEVPAAAALIDHLAAELDFFSIGTNDLSQYFLAADRGNPAVAAVATVRHPGFVRLLREIVRAVHAHNRWVGVCGEMAADPLCLPLFVGLGVNEISVTPSVIPGLKARLRRLSSQACGRLVERVVSCARTSEVEALLSEHDGEDANVPLLDSSLVVLQDTSTTKLDAIHAVVGALYVAGRTDAPDAVEAAVLAREAIYSTGLGHGIAIPHCKTDAVETDSIVILRLARPVEWGAVDGVPVHLVILLATRASSPNTRHLQVFSGLARKLMHDAFREQLLTYSDARAMATYLSAELALDRSVSSSSVSEVSS